MGSQFLETLKKGRHEREKQSTPARSSQVHAALEVLRQFCSAIKQYADGKLQCYLDAGFHVNMGQEWRVMIEPLGRTTSGYVLLRVYVPETGFPATLNLYEDELVECKTRAQLERELNRFLAKPSVQETIELLSTPQN